MQMQLWRFDECMKYRSTRSPEQLPRTSCPTIMQTSQEFIPVPLPDENEAGSVWRSEKLRDFVFRLRCMGLEEDPQFACLVSQIAEQTEALEQLSEQQKQPSYKRPWWQDGEYDSNRADGANDEGMELFAAGRHSQAFDCFTEAIRLSPTSAVYHCNRAAAALKLGRPDIAAEDADNAAQRDPAYLRAHLRAGRARLQLQQPEQAQCCFARALELDAGCAAAAKGLAEAAQLAAQQQRQAEAELAAAQRGSRPGLRRDAVPEEEAVGQLYAAEQMLAANPSLQTARCAHVEALLLCQRYADAEAACSSLLEGSTDRLYLEAEAAWRQGSLGVAADKLYQALQVAPGSQKCSSLLAYLESLQQLEQEAALALEDGMPQRCMEACDSLLTQLSTTACVGLACSVLHRRAEAQAARQAWQEAIADLDRALALDASHAACLQLRAEAHKQAGAYTQCFLDLQRLKKMAPGTPGLFRLLEEAARLSLGGASSGQRACGDSAAARAGGTAAAEAALAVLGIPPSATAAQARQAYLKLAAKWHPDKWSSGTAEEQQAAEERFKEVQKAYELLTAA